MKGINRDPTYYLDGTGNLDGIYSLNYIHLSKLNLDNNYIEYKENIRELERPIGYIYLSKFNPYLSKFNLKESIREPWYQNLNRRSRASSLSHDTLSHPKAQKDQKLAAVAGEINTRHKHAKGRFFPQRSQCRPMHMKCIAHHMQFIVNKGVKDTIKRALSTFLTPLMPQRFDYIF